MILKKPYAFLIKYFKVINLLISLLAGYSAYRFYKIITFFNEYINSNYSGNYYLGFYEEYISIFNYLTIILILIGIGGILLLFIYKKKTVKTYILSFVYYLVYFVILSIIKNLMISLEINTITAETARLYRDLTTIFFLPQLFFVIQFLIRGFGYNLDKFNFKQDLKNLEIAQGDNDEVEIVLKNDGFKIKRGIRRFFREFIYYVKENKFMVIIISVLVLTIGGYNIYKSLPSKVDENYKQGDYFNQLGIRYSITDSILTNLDYKGEIIKKGKYYLVVKLNITNNSNEQFKLDFNRFRLELNKDLIYPSLDKGVLFVDYAKNNISNIVAKESSNTFALVYEIDSNDLKKNYTLKIDSGIQSNKKELVGKYTFVSIAPVLVDEINVEGNYKLDSEVSFINSNLKNTSIKLANLEITDKYTYNYEFCTSYDNCDTYVNQVKIDNQKNNTTLIVLDQNFIIDNNIPYYTTKVNVGTFISNFGKIRYLEDKKEYYAKLTNVTPNNLDGKVILETSAKIKKSEELALILTIRNKEYIIYLKELT